MLLLVLLLMMTVVIIIMIPKITAMTIFISVSFRGSLRADSLRLHLDKEQELFFKCI